MKWLFWAGVLYGVYRLTAPKTTTDTILGNVESCPKVGNQYVCDASSVPECAQIGAYYVCGNERADGKRVFSDPYG
jgi:hypothetical protein